MATLLLVTSGARSTAGLPVHSSSHQHTLDPWLLTLSYTSLVFMVPSSYLLSLSGCSHCFLRAEKLNSTGMHCPVLISLSTGSFPGPDWFTHTEITFMAHLLFAGHSYLSGAAPLCHQSQSTTVVLSAPCPRASACHCSGSHHTAGQQLFSRQVVEKMPGRAPQQGGAVALPHPWHTGNHRPAAHPFSLPHCQSVKQG